MLNNIVIRDSCNANNVELVVKRHIKIAEIDIGSLYHMFAFGVIDSHYRISGKNFAGLYFHKNYAFAFLGYDINFKTVSAPFALTNGVTKRYEIVCSNLFAPVAFGFFIDWRPGRISVFDRFSVSHFKVLFIEEFFELLHEGLTCLTAYKTDVLFLAILEEKEHWD